MLVLIVIPASTVPVRANVFVPVPLVAVTVELPDVPTLRLSVAAVPLSDIGFAILIVFEVDSLRVVDTPRVLVALAGDTVTFWYVSKRATACTSELDTVSAGAEFVTLTSSIAKNAPCAVPPVASQVPLMNTYL